MHQSQFLPRVGQGNHQGMKAPAAIAGDVHSRIAMAECLLSCSVGVDDRFLKKLGGVMCPHIHSRFINCTVEAADVRDREAMTEIDGRGRAANARGAESIQIRLIIPWATPFADGSQVTSGSSVANIPQRSHRAQTPVEGSNESETDRVDRLACEIGLGICDNQGETRR